MKGIHLKLLFAKQKHQITSRFELLNWLVCIKRCHFYLHALKVVVLITDSTNSEHFATPMGVLVETIYGNSSKTMLLPGGVTAFVPTQPLAMTMLDSLTIHAKMRSDTSVYDTRIQGRLLHINDGANAPWKK